MLCVISYCLSIHVQVEQWLGSQDWPWPGLLPATGGTAHFASDMVAGLS